MSNIQKRYQVFVSSTYEDLKEERMEVLHALLELDCIPCGMEYFPASSESQWKYITQLIDNCDYYMVIVGNRYGSEAEDGKSYTQKEFEYAVEKGIPVIGFLHNEPTSISMKKSETNIEKQEKLQLFRKAVQKRLCKYWKNPSDLGGVVSRSLMQEIKHNPRLGWVRANELDKLPTNGEMVAVMKENKNLKEKLDKLSAIKSDSIKQLSSGSDEVAFDFEYMILEEKQDESIVLERSVVEMTSNWDELFFVLAKHIKGEGANWRNFGHAMSTIFVNRILKENQKEGVGIVTSIISPSSNQVVQHLYAIGLLSYDGYSYGLTNKGELKYVRSKALPKGQKKFVEETLILTSHEYTIDGVGDYSVGDVIPQKKYRILDY